MDETTYAFYYRLTGPLLSPGEVENMLRRLRRSPFYNWRRMAVRPFDPRVPLVRPIASEDR